MTSKTRKELIEEEAKTVEYVVDLEKLEQNHRWIDRGAKLSCEGAGHKYHQVWKRR